MKIYNLILLNFCFIQLFSLLFGMNPGPSGSQPGGMHSGESSGSQPAGGMYPGEGSKSQPGGMYPREGPSGSQPGGMHSGESSGSQQPVEPDVCLIVVK